MAPPQADSAAGAVIVDVCNVCSRRFLPQSLTMIWSLSRFAGHYRFHIFLSDVTAAEGVGLARSFPHVAFHFIDQFASNGLLDSALLLTDLEFNVSLKGMALESVLAAGGQIALYCDSDLLFMAPPDAAIAELGQSSVLMTPHHLQPGRDADMLAMARTGVFNSGFVGASGAEGLRFARWWRDICERYCLLEPEEGVFVDQKWLDLAASLFTGASAFRDGGYNVAYWNIADRAAADQWVVLHLSGLDPNGPLSVDYPLSKHAPDVKIGLELAAALQPYGEQYRAICAAVDQVPGLPGNSTPFGRLVAGRSDILAKRRSATAQKVRFEDGAPVLRDRTGVDPSPLPDMQRRAVPILGCTRQVGNVLVALRMGRILDAAISVFRVLSRRSSWLK